MVDSLGLDLSIAEANPASSVYPWIHDVPCAACSLTWVGRQSRDGTVLWFTAVHIQLCSYVYTILNLNSERGINVSLTSSMRLSSWFWLTDRRLFRTRLNSSFLSRPVPSGSKAMKPDLMVGSLSWSRPSPPQWAAGLNGRSLGGLGGWHVDVYILLGILQQIIHYISLVVTHGFING